MSLCNFMPFMIMTSRMFLFFARLQYHHIGQNWFVLLQTYTFIPEDKLTLGIGFRNFFQKMVTSQVSRQRSLTLNWEHIHTIQYHQQILREFHLYQYLILNLCCKQLQFKISIHLKMAILSQVYGKRLSLM
jgi:hypothetical protein